MSDILSVLVSASRPYKPFEVEINGQKFNLLARRPGNAEAAVIGKVWNDTYEEGLAKLDSQQDTVSIQRNLNRQTNEKLAKYIAKADRLDLLGEASILCGDKPTDDPTVQAKADELVLEREKDLCSAPREDLLQLAMDRRNNVQALIEANTSSLKVSLKYMVYASEGEPLVQDDAQLDLLTEEVIERIVIAANKALEVPKDADPLSSPDSAQ